MHGRNRTWEQMGAASGLLATLLFVIAFIVFLGTSPGGDPALPNIKHADTAPAFLAAHLTAIRVVVLLSALGLALFLWFLASLWTTLREAEDGASAGRRPPWPAASRARAWCSSASPCWRPAGSPPARARPTTSPPSTPPPSLADRLGVGVSAIFFFAVAKVILQPPAPSGGGSGYSRSSPACSRSAAS